MIDLRTYFATTDLITQEFRRRNDELRGHVERFQLLLAQYQAHGAVPELVELQGGTWWNVPAELIAMVGAMCVRVTL